MARTGIREELHRGFWWENLGERQHVESLYVGRRAILKWAFKKQVGVLDWVDIAQDSDR